MKKKKVFDYRYSYFTKLQRVFIAINNGADYIAPYYNRMQNQGIDAMKVIDSLRTEIERTQKSNKNISSCFKIGEQVTTAIRSGAHAITLSKSY